MDGGRVYDGSHMISMLENSSDSIWVPSSTSFHETMVNFDQDGHRGKRRTPKGDRLRATSDGEETGGEEFELNPFRHPEKKRRLTLEQVQFLEKNFEVENKLEPERKVELAKELGLQPRQVAIWFQNRRARFKTKQLEKDYDSLKASYDNLKVDYDNLIKERENLQNEVKLLTKKLKQRDMGRVNSDPHSPDNPPHREGISKMETEKGTKMEALVAPTASIKHIEDASSAKSDVFDSESPHCNDANQSPMLEGPPDSSYMLDPDLQSDFSQDEEDHQLLMNKSLLLPTLCNNVLKVEEGCYDANATSCSFSFVDEQPFWSPALLA